MAKVNAKVGFTLKIRKDSQFEFIRPEIGIDSIDTDEDITTQLDLAEKALKETWDKVTSMASEEILSQMGDLDQELQLQLQKKFKKIDAVIDDLRTQIEKKANKKESE
tara:strand:- start:8632 stop:8955 length:324 start_codon:yes stop_codon:yes gene_type:complete